MKTLPHTYSCFVCGEANPIGFRLRFETDGRVVQSRFVLRPEHVGFRQTIHGGIIATLLDEAMVWACAVQTRRFAFCAELNVRFVKPTHPQSELIVQAELAANRRDRLFEAKGELRAVDDGLLLASSTGKYVPISEEKSKELARDFVGKPEW
jgi:acyl-coenzyme A thioesterase PaaI-like protein